MNEETELLDRPIAKEIYTSNIRDFHQNWVTKEIGNWSYWCDEVRVKCPVRVKEIERKLETAYRIGKEYINGNKSFFDMCNAWEDWSVSSLDLYDFCK